MRWFTVVALAVLFPVLTPAPASACSCFGRTPICESFWRTPLVFSGEVLDVTPVPNELGAQFMPQRRIRFRVDQTWRGGTSPEMDVMTGSGGGDCGYTFERGVRYIVYAYLRGGVPWTGICDRTRPLAKAAEDLDYLKTAFAPSATGRVFGTATYRRDNSEMPARAARGYTVVLSDANSEQRATTDDEGRYVFGSVPAGKYKIELKVPSTQVAYGRREVELHDPRGCAAADFSIHANGRIAARVVTADGKAASGVLIGVVDAENADRYPVGRAATNGEGEASLDPLEPGRYLVGINVREAPNAKQPYPTTYFPGVVDRSAATVVDLAAGQRVDLGTLVLPRRLQERSVTGVVVGLDGKPIAGARVSVDVNFNSVGSAKTDGDGAFSVSVYDGVTYQVSAYYEVPGPERLQWSSPRVKVVASDAMAPLSIVLSPPRR